MNRIKSRLQKLLTPTTIILLLILNGCAATYIGNGPQWDGNVFFHDVHDHSYRFTTFHEGDNHRAPTHGGRISTGPHTHGGPHTPSHIPSSGGAHLHSTPGHK